MADQTIVDPLGRPVTLHDHTWYGHVLNIHPEMRGRRAEAADVIRRPTIIHFSYDVDARLYHGPRAADGMMVAVIADVKLGIAKLPTGRSGPKSTGMAVIDTIEGLVGDDIDFHYDVGNDVLYLRLIAEKDADAWGDEEDGIIVRRRVDNDAIIGVTVVAWWKRFGTGALPDSLAELARQVEPMTQRLAA